VYYSFETANSGAWVDGSLAGLRTFWILFLLVALAGASPVFAQDPLISLTPDAACPGTKVIVTSPTFGDVAGGSGDSIMQTRIMQPTIVISSDPSGLIGTQVCGLLGECSFVVSQYASCGHYNVIITTTGDGLSAMISLPFDVPGYCCAVGGRVQPVNTLALLSPWLAVIGLVGCIGAVAVVVRKRRS
jgi:hypothetical protein